MKRPEPTGIHFLSLPASLPTGTINVYFVEEPCPTLIDVPPNDTALMHSLENALFNLGYSLKDIKRIIVSHPHFDHFGCARSIVEQSGAEVWTFGKGARYLEDFEKELSLDFAYYSDFLKKAGAPRDADKYIKGFYTTAKILGCRVKVSRYLEDGDEIELGRTKFRVMHVPGHTPWCILVYELSRKVAFTGDFLIKEISSNAILQRPLIVPQGYKSLKNYISSLEKVKQLGLKKALPGHGLTIEDPNARIEEVLSSINNRKYHILHILKKDFYTPFQIVGKLFPTLIDEHVLLAFSEIMGYLELLEEEGSVERKEEPLLQFSTT